MRMDLDETPTMYHVKRDLEQAFGSLAKLELVDKFRKMFYR